MPSRRLANDLVNPSGICCVIKIPGQSDGIWTKNSLIASVPPVDAPIMINFSLLVSGLRISGNAASPVRPAPAGEI